MTNTWNRREFMEASGAAASFLIATGYSPFSYAQNEKVRVACIGTGGQGTFHIQTGLTGAEAIQIVAVCDVYRPHQEYAVLRGRLANAKIFCTTVLSEEEKQQASAALKPKAYYDYKEMLSKEEIDGVIISTPLYSHVPIAIDCLDAGKYVFCEKALAPSIEEGRRLLKKCAETKRWVQVGHQRRYNPKYNLGMWMVYNKGMLGRINHITAQWHRNHYWRRVLDDTYQLSDIEKKFIHTDLEHHLNWRLYSETSGGLYTELATHQTDIANWFMRAVPSRVHAFAGLDYWRDGRTVDDNILVSYEYDQKPSSEGFFITEKHSKFQDESLINKAYTVRFAYSSILTNAKRGASELIQGEYGTLELTEDICKYYPEDVIKLETKATDITSGASLNLPPDALIKGVGMLDDVTLKEPDTYQFEAFVESIRNGTMPRTNQLVGYTTAITAIAAMESQKTGRTIEIDPSWMEFDFDVPSFTEYDPSWGALQKEKAPEPVPPTAELASESSSTSGASSEGEAVQAAPPTPAVSTPPSN